MQEAATKVPQPEIFYADAMDEDQNTVEPTQIVEYVHVKIKELEDDVSQNNNRIVELEHDLTRKEDDTT